MWPINSAQTHTGDHPPTAKPRHPIPPPLQPPVTKNINSSLMLKDQHHPSCTPPSSDDRNTTLILLKTFYDVRKVLDSSRFVGAKLKKWRLLPPAGHWSVVHVMRLVQCPLHFKPGEKLPGSKGWEKVETGRCWAWLQTNTSSSLHRNGRLLLVEVVLSRSAPRVKSASVCEAHPRSWVPVSCSHLLRAPLNCTLVRRRWEGQERGWTLHKDHEIIVMNNQKLERQRGQQKHQQT